MEIGDNKIWMEEEKNEYGRLGERKYYGIPFLTSLK
jgi:hypothetical protein